MKKAIGVGLFLLGFMAALNFFLPAVARAQKEQPAEAPGGRDLLIADVDAAETLYEEGRLDDAEKMLLSVRQRAEAQGVDLGRSGQRKVENILDAIADKRVAARREALLQKARQARELYDAGKFAQAETAAKAVKAEAETQGISLGWSTGRSLNSIISNAQERIAEGAADAEKTRLAAASQAASDAEKAAQAALKDQLLARFEQGKRLFKEGNYADARPILQGVSDDAAKNSISFGFSIDRELRRMVADANKAIIAKAAADEKAQQAAAEQAQAKARAAETAAAREAAAKEEARKAGVEQELRARFTEAEALYNKGDYEASLKAFSAIKERREAEDISLGWSANRAIDSYISKSEKAIAQAAEDKVKAAEAAAKAEADAKRKAQADAQRMEAEAKRVAEAEAKAKAEADARASQVAQREAAAKAEAQAKAAAAAEREARAKAEAEAKARAAAEREAALKEAEAKRTAEAQARAKAEADAKAKEAAEREAARREAEAKRIADAEAKAAAEAEAGAKETAEREAKLKAEQEAKAKEIAERDAKRKAEADAKAQAQAQAQAERKAADAAEAARDARRKEVVARLEQAGDLYKEGKYAQAKPLLLEVKSAVESEEIELGFWDRRALNNYLEGIDERVAEEQAGAARVAGQPAPQAQAPAERPMAAPAERPAPVDTQAVELARAEAAYREGLDAFRAGDFQKAQDMAYRALSMRPGYPDAEVLLELTQKRIAEAEPPADDYQQMQEVRQRAIQAEILNSLSEARRAIVEEKWTAAQVAAQRAREVAEANVQMGFEQYVKEANDLLRSIEPQMARVRADEARQRQRTAEQELADQRKALETQRQRDIDALMEQANEHIKQENYAGAAASLDAVLELRPDYAYGRVLRELVGQWANAKANQEIEMRRRDSLRKTHTEASERLVFDTAALAYPENWLQKMEGRDAFIGTASEGIGKSIETQEVERKLGKRLASFDFVGQTFEAAIEFLRFAGDLNVVVDEAVPLDTPVSLQLANSTIRQILDLLTKKVDMTYIVRENYVYISDEEGIRGITSTADELTRVYDINDLIAPILDAQGAQGGGRGGGGGAGGSRGGGAGGRSGGGGGGNRGFGGGFGDGADVSRRFGGGGAYGGGGEGIGEGFGGGGLGGGFGGGAGGAGGGGGGAGQAYTEADSTGYTLAQEILNVVEPGVWNQPPDPFTIRYYTGGRLIVRAPEDVQEKVQRFLQQLRELRSMWVVCEARLIRIGTGFLDEFDVRYPFIDFFAEDDGGAFTSFTASFQPGGVGVSGPVSGGAGVSGLSFLVDYLDGIEVQAFVNMIQINRSFEDVSWQTIQLANNQMGFLDTLTTRPYISEISTTVAESAVGYEVSVDELDYGITYQLRPTISYDRRYVQIDFTPTISDIVSSSLYSFATTDGTNTVELITTSETSLSATVSIPDGGTALIAGTGRAIEENFERGAPILMHLPLIGRFFKFNSQVSDRETFIILLTPHIVIREEYEARL